MCLLRLLKVDFPPGILSEKRLLLGEVTFLGYWPPPSLSRCFPRVHLLYNFSPKSFLSLFIPISRKFTVTLEQDRGNISEGKTITNSLFHPVTWHLYVTPTFQLRGSLPPLPPPPPPPWIVQGALFISSTPNCKVARGRGRRLVWLQFWFSQATRVLIFFKRCKDQDGEILLPLGPLALQDAFCHGKIIGDPLQKPVQVCPQWHPPPELGR